MIPTDNFNVKITFRACAPYVGQSITVTVKAADAVEAVEKAKPNIGSQILEVDAITVKRLFEKEL